MKSKVYPVKGVFSASCARHETVLKLVDMETGEGFKYPLAIVHQLLGDSGSDGMTASTSPNINIMYDIVCKLEHALKVLSLKYIKGNMFSLLISPLLHLGQLSWIDGKIKASSSCIPCVCPRSTLSDYSQSQI